MPNEQNTHVFAVAPDVARALPPAQAAQTLAPVASAKNPALQVTQLDAPVDPIAVPAAQLAHVGAAATEYFPAAQFKQNDTPVAPKFGEAVPGMQPTQLPSPGAAA